MISVIIPVFNGEKTIRRAVKSVMHNQGVTSELIVVDDGSTDRTPEILHELSANMSIRIIRQENMGPGMARNAALEQAQGDFIVFLDADDYLLPMALTHMLACMLAHGTEACVAGTRQLVGKIPVSNSIECWHKVDQTTIDVFDGNFLVEITPGVRAKMFRREILTGLEFTRSKWEDLAFIPAALARARWVSILNEPVYAYRIHINTTVKDFFRRCQVEDIITAAEALERNLQDLMVNNSKLQACFKSIFILHTVFRMHNVMTWVDTRSTDKQQVIKALAERLAQRYPDWRKDAVLCDPVLGYQDPFFKMLLKRLYGKFLS